jgi:hypothetical protein
MNRTILSLPALLLALLFLTGCGEQLPDGMPKLYPALITVTQEGEPLEEATVMLIPEDSALMQWGPSGITDESGIAEMKTNAKYKGAPLGKYTVTVMKREREPHPHPEWAGLSETDPNYRQFVQIARMLKHYDLVESHFGSVANSPLRIEVSAGQKEYTVDVGKKVKVETVTLR